MPYAHCPTCEKTMTRPGGRGVRLRDFVCPFCGERTLRNAPTPAPIAALDTSFPKLSCAYAAMPQAAAAWLWAAWKGNAEWVDRMRGERGYVLRMDRSELTRILQASHPDCQPINDADYEMLIGRTASNEGVFLIWQDAETARFEVDDYTTVVVEARQAGLVEPYHVYARYAVYQSPSVLFYKLPDRVLTYLGQGLRYHATTRRSS